MMTEEWRDISDYEGYYQVSNLGRVRSIDRITVNVDGVIRPVAGRVLVQSADDRGYPGVVLCKNNQPAPKRVHQLVLEAFAGVCPDGMESCHNDGDPSNNVLENLRWDTLSSNQMDRVAHGTDNRGKRHGMAKLSAQDVLGIRAFIKFTKIPQARLAELYGVTAASITHIKNGQSWSWLGEDHAGVS